MSVKMQKNTRLFGLIGILSVLIFFGPFITLFGPARLRDYVHKELVYKVITSRLAKKDASPKKKALALFEYVHTHLFSIKAKVIDEHPLNDLIRGIGWCDQQANTLITLARKARINGHLIFLRGYDRISHHSVCELFIDGKYCIFDPYFGFVFFTPEKNIATFGDIQDRNVEISSKQFDALEILRNQDPFPTPGAYEPRAYFRLYEKTYEPLLFRSNYQTELKRFLLAGLIDLYYDVFGNAFLLLYQESYFKLSNIPPLAKARLKHLSFRFKSAIHDYNHIAEIFGNDFEKSESIFFKGQALWDMQDYSTSIRELQKLLRDYPDTRWKDVAFYYLANSYENLKDFEKARFYYSKIAGNSQTPAPVKLIDLTRI